MAGIPPIIMLGSGIAQGFMAYQQGQESANVAKANADRARKMQTYERRIKEQNVAQVAAEEKTAITQQEYTNAAVEGAATAAMGAAGVSLTGSFMEVLGEIVIQSNNKKAIIKQKSGRVKASVENAGNIAIFNQEFAENSYLKAAKAARLAGTRGFVMGVASGIVGFQQAGGDWSKLFGKTAAKGSLLGSNPISVSQLSPIPTTFESSFSLFGGPGTPFQFPDLTMPNFSPTISF